MACTDPRIRRPEQSEQVSEEPSSRVEAACDYHLPRWRFEGSLNCSAHFAARFQVFHQREELLPPRQQEQQQDS
jgi:hypothetical protein